jgi:hypothetical protein
MAHRARQVGAVAQRITQRRRLVGQVDEANAGLVDAAQRFDDEAHAEPGRDQAQQRDRLAELLLQALQAHAQRRLRQRQQRGGTPDVADLGERDETMQLLEVHGALLGEVRRYQQMRCLAQGIDR